MKKPQPKPAHKPQPRSPRPSYPTEQAVNRIMAILRPLSPDERAQVLRSVAAYYQG
jgi:hypothetical protein